MHEYAVEVEATGIRAGTGREHNTHVVWARTERAARSEAVERECQAWRVNALVEVKSVTRL